MGSYYIKEESDKQSGSFVQLNVEGEDVSIRNIKKKTIQSVEQIKSAKTMQVSGKQIQFVEDEKSEMV